MSCMKAGAGKAEIIFPKEMFPLEGFIQVHDHPQIRILVLENQLRFALVSIDLVTVTQEMIESIKARIYRRTETLPEHIWIHVTHSTATPHYPKLQKEAQTQAENQQKMYFNALMTAADQALDTVMPLKDAWLKSTEALCDLNVNRDMETPFGWWIGQNENGPSNKQMTLIRINDAAQKMIASVLSYGIKPCAVDQAGKAEGKRQVTADVTGFACRALEEQFQAPVLFFMSASGDQVPRKQAWWEAVQPDGTVAAQDMGVETGLQLAYQQGLKLAQTAAEALNGLISDDCPCLKHGKASFIWPTKERISLVPRKTLTYTPDGKQVELPIEVLTLGDLAFVAVKPEICCSTEMALKEKSPFAHTLLISMVNGGMKYMPDELSYRRICWEAMNSSLMPGAAEEFLRVSEALLEKMKDSEKEAA